MGQTSYAGIIRIRFKVTRSCCLLRSQPGMPPSAPVFMSTKQYTHSALFVKGWRRPGGKTPAGKGRRPVGPGVFLPYTICSGPARQPPPYGEKMRRKVKKIRGTDKNPPENLWKIYSKNRGFGARLPLQGGGSLWYDSYTYCITVPTRNGEVGCFTSGIQ